MSNVQRSGRENLYSIEKERAHWKCPLCIYLSGDETVAGCSQPWNDEAARTSEGSSNDATEKEHAVDSVSRGRATGEE
jgi:hypothetical protein